jgi:hypothetical protein
MFLSKRTLLHQSAHLPIPAQQPARSGVSIGLGSTVIFAAAQLVRPLAALLNVRNPEED